MPDKGYRIFLENGFVIAVSIQMVEGRVVGFVVRLIHISGQNERDLARYDTAHGLPHLDLLGQDGKLKEKRWLQGVSFEQALTAAIEDFKENHEKYLGQSR
jgi:hypothetical protein